VTSKGSSKFMSRDTIYQSKSSKVGDFTFDDQVAEVFPDMISRSVPGYASILAMIGELAVRYVVPHSRVYDLGCSLGAATAVVCDRVKVPCKIVAIDNSAAMLAKMRENLVKAKQSDGQDCEVELVEMSIQESEICDASFVILNLTLQFLPPAERAGVLRRIYEGLRPGGCLLLAEKLKFDDEQQQSLITELHHDFKRAHGYSELEIAQKRTAIENRLIPETLEQHIDRLKQVGFSTIVPWFQCFSFASMLAIKTDEAPR